MRLCIVAEMNCSRFVPPLYERRWAFILFCSAKNPVVHRSPLQRAAKFRRRRQEMRAVVRRVLSASLEVLSLSLIPLYAGGGPPGVRDQTGPTSFVGVHEFYTYEDADSYIRLFLFLLLERDILMALSTGAPGLEKDAEQ